MSWARDVCDAVLRRRLGNYDQLPQAERDTFAKDMASIIADVAIVLIAARTPDEMALSLDKLAAEMQEIAKWP